MLTTKIWRSTFGRVQSKSAPGPGWKRADLAACVLKIRAKTLRWCRWSLAGVGLASLLAACTPAGPRALLNGERLIREGKYAQAITRLETATKLLPGNAQAFNHLGLAYHKSGQPAAALKAYEQARRCDPNLTSVHFNLGCLLLEQNNPSAAVSELTTYTLLQADAPAGWVKLGTAQLRTRQFDAAERSFQTALRLHPDLAEAWNGIGVAQAQHRRAKEAITSFSTALQKQAAYGPALLNTAIVYQYYLNNHALALQRYQEYVSLTPTPADAAAVEEVARQLQAELNPPAAHNEVTNGTVAPTGEPAPVHVAAPPANTSPAAVANARTSTNNSLAANAPATNRSHTVPKTQLTASDLAPRVNKAAAEIPKRTEDIPGAARTETAAANPVSHPQIPAPEPSSRVETNSPATETPARTQAQPANSPAEVVRLTDEMPPKAAQDSGGSSSDANAQPRVATPAQLDQASALLTRKIEEPPREPVAEEKNHVLDKLNPASWFKGKRRSPSVTSLDASGEEKSSRTPASPGHLSESVAVAPLAIPRYSYRSPKKPAVGNRVKADPYFAEAVAAHRNGRLDEAIENYRKATKLDPSFYEAQYNLGLAAYTLKDLSQSFAAYELALAINPKSTNARYNFALALQQAGYFQDAANELEKLIDQSPEEARAHFSLASLYAEKLGQPSQARPHYRKVLELEPQHPQALAIRYWLAANP